MIEQADYLTVNDYEAEVVARKTGVALDQLARKVKALVVTLGGEGARFTLMARSTVFRWCLRRR